MTTRNIKLILLLLFVLLIDIASGQNIASQKDVQFGKFYYKPLTELHSLGMYLSPSGTLLARDYQERFKSPIERLGDWKIEGDTLQIEVDHQSNFKSEVYTTFLLKPLRHIHFLVPMALDWQLLSAELEERLDQDELYKYALVEGKDDVETLGRVESELCGLYLIGKDVWILNDYNLFASKPFVRYSNKLVGQKTNGNR